MERHHLRIPDRRQSGISRCASSLSATVYVAEDHVHETDSFREHAAVKERR